MDSHGFRQIEDGKLEMILVAENRTETSSEAGRESQ